MVHSPSRVGAVFTTLDARALPIDNPPNAAWAIFPRLLTLARVSQACEPRLRTTKPILR
jgi:hypothetical protein